MPWNFQHNIHVDEGFTGLPPSWTTSLAKAGFTDEEIADLHRRRTAGSRSPGSQYLYNERPDSPAYTASNAPILTHPTPRTTSLPRTYSDASLRTVDTGARSPPPPLPPSSATSTPALPNRSLPQRQFSTDHSSLHHHYPSSSIHSSSHSISTSGGSHITHGSMTSFAQDAAARANSPHSASDRTHPSTPPRRTYHVTNEGMNSPPPSYTHYNIPQNAGGSSYPLDRKVPIETSSMDVTPRSHPSAAPSAVTPETTPQRYQRPRATTDTSHGRTASASASSSSHDESPPSRIRADSRSKRLTALPPRLSLHKSNDSSDLSSWGEALLSGISTASDLATPNTSTFAVAQESKLSSTTNGASQTNFVPTNSTYYARAQAQAAKHASPPTKIDDVLKRQPPPTRPIPPLNVRKAGTYQSAIDSDEDNGPSSSVVEPASTARYDPAATSWDEPQILSSKAPPSPLWNELQSMVSEEQAVPYSPALEDTLSPTLPRSPGAVPRPWLKDDGESRDRGVNRDSSRSSTSTVMALQEPATIVRKVSIARRTGAYVVEKSKLVAEREGTCHPSSSAGSSVGDPRHPPSPLSSNFGSEEGSASGSGSSSSLSQEQQTPTTDPGLDSSLMYYLDSTASPGPNKLSFSPIQKVPDTNTDNTGDVRDDDEEEEEDYDEEDDEGEEQETGTSTGAPLQRPKIVISGDTSSPGPTPAISSSGLTPLSPYQRYRGWLSAVVAPLEEFIDDAVDPREFYLDLQEIAEGESGSVFAARLTGKNIQRLRLPARIKVQDNDDLLNGRTTLVAIKSVAILPSGSPKLVDLQRELSLMKGLWHENLLSMDAVYVDLVEDTLWIRMELMERSLADIIGLVGQGLILQDRTIARFASDVLQALEFLQQHDIAHRDVRSDNLLLNSGGILKLTDFSNAARVTKTSPMLSDIVGVAYWQAPEVRTPPYNALKVDVWSLGATVWEMAESEPPFAETQQFGDRWPPLSQPKLYSPTLHDFLRQCSEPPLTRPTAGELRKTPFINNACGRPVIIQLISQCMAIEQALLEGDASRGNISE